PIKKAFYISLTGRNLTGLEAERIGLVSQVVPENELDSYVETLAKEIASRNGATLESAKIAAYMQKDLPFHMALQADDLVQHRMRYYTNPLSDVEGYLHSQKGAGTVKYAKAEDMKQFPSLLLVADLNNPDKALPSAATVVENALARWPRVQKLG